VCRTDLHVVDGELPAARLPAIPGHEIVGRVVEVGAGVTALKPGDRVGIPWLGHTCGHCAYCRSGAENLCDTPGFTGYTLAGGYAEYTVADSRYCFLLPEGFTDAELAPWLCAGLIGWLLRHQRREFLVFTSPGATAHQAFARELGAAWAGDSDEPSPAPLDAALLFAPVGALVPKALADTRRGGTVVCAGIHMSDIPRFPYALLWGERQLRSVANLTRQDGDEFIALAQQVPIRTTVTTYPLADANRALADLRQDRVTGAAVLIVD
jgi:propanol-preferring alcohol dehydrogenase